MTIPAPDPDDTITLPRADYDRLVSWAAGWQLWWSPAAIAHRSDETERRYQERIRAVSWDIAAAADWADPDLAPVGHRELHHRRYPWLHDPDWRCRHHQPHGQCSFCALPAGPGFRKDYAA